MEKKGADIYKGTDWLTSRWPVAEAMDTLDRMNDLCMCGTSLDSGEFSGGGRFHAGETDIGKKEIFAALTELLDCLSAEISFARADLQTALWGNVDLSWSAFEAELLTMAMVKKLEDCFKEKSGGSFEVMVPIIKGVKEILKKIDQ